jgi:methyl-branched lipid omega-hydroxylase
METPSQPAFEVADEINLSDPLLWTAPEEIRNAAFGTLRRERPAAFFEEPTYESIPSGPGYWGLTKHDDVVFASRHPELFASGNGTNIGTLPAELNEMLGSMINMDSPRHTKMRRLVNKGFTPRMVARIEDHVHEIARQCIEDIAGKGTCDFVTEVAAPMPLRIICDMLGIPREDTPFILEQTNHLLGAADPEYNSTIEEALSGGWSMWNYAQELGAQRLANPQDDITSALMQAEVDGERLTAAEFGSFFVLLCSAGNETTRNAIAHGLLELTRHPDQRKLLLEDPDAHIPGAVEEIVRYSTPVIHFRRTATQDIELPSGRAAIKAGEKVVLWYTSANRDEEVFDRPDEFEVQRTPNDHLGFGGGGPHFCLGANLARREVRVLFEELFRVLPDIEVVGEPNMLQSNFVHGIKHLNAEFTAR